MPRRHKPPETAIPDYCDFDCPHASFPPADTAGICRTMSAVWCGLLHELVNKNAPCEWKRRGNRAAGESRVSRRTERAGNASLGARGPTTSRVGRGTPRDAAGPQVGSRRGTRPGRRR